MKKILIALFMAFIFIVPTLAIQEGYYISGIGVKMNLENDVINITWVMPDTPAQKAGLKKDDIILEVDGWEAKDLDKASEKIKGESGTTVKLLIKRGEETIPFNITRANIYVSNYVEIYNGTKAYFNMRYLKYEDGVYYFWIKELYGAWGQYKNYGYKNYDHTKRYIAIDLRNEEIAELQVVMYDKKGELIYNSEDYDDEAEFKQIIPNTVGHTIFSLIKILDTLLKKEGVTDEEREKIFKGFYNET